jgi:hypothetical protein
LKVGWGKVSPGRLSPARAKAAFEAAAERCDAVRIAEAGERYLALDPDVARLGTAISLHVWLDEDRFEPWLGAADPAPRRRFAGPAAIRDRVARAEGEAFVGSWLDPAGWDEASQAVIPANSIAAERLAAAGVPLTPRGKP